MTSLTLHVRVNAFQSEPGIAIVIETLGAPFGGRPVATVAQSYPLPAELAAMFVAMAGGAHRWRLSIHSIGHRRSVGVAHAPLAVTVAALSLGVSARERISGSLIVVVWPDREGARIANVADGAVARQEVGLELRAMGVLVAILTQTGGGDELLDLGLPLGFVALTAWDGRVLSRKGIDGLVPCDIVPRGFEAGLFMAVQARREAALELSGVGVLMTAFALTWD